MQTACRQGREPILVVRGRDPVALLIIITGTHTGDYLGHAPTGEQIQTSASYFLRIRDDAFVEQWEVMDTYRILVKIGDPRRRGHIPADAQCPGRP